MSTFVFWQNFKQIKKYIVPIDGRPSGAILVLGHYDHDLEWPKPDQDDGGINPASSLRHHKQFYVNGTKCDLTGELRRTEVRVNSLI